MASGPGVFFDGITSAQHDVNVEVAPDMLRISAADGRVLAEWPYGELQALSAPDDMLRVGRAGSPVLARLEVREPQLAAEIDELSIPIDRAGGGDRRTRRRVIGWTVAATISLVLVAIFGIPVLAGSLTPLVPYVLESRLGEAAEAQMRMTLDPRNSGDAFECGRTPAQQAGRAALDRLIERLGAAAALPIPLRGVVVHRHEANAFALPGGHIYVFEGLIDKAQTADELAAVLAHEIGHVAHRDATKSILEGAGLSFMFGMLLGDFVGGGAVVIGAKKVLQSSYSRDVESAADMYSVDLLTKVGGDPRALVPILQRIAGDWNASLKILLDHPDTKDRVAAILARAPERNGGMLLDPGEWAALKRICAAAKE